MTINEMQDSIIDEFSRLHDWLQKYEYLIELGKIQGPPDSEIKTEQFSLNGCQSQVWIQANLIDGKVFFIADSDSLIIRGILALLLKTLNNQFPADIAKADLYFLGEIGLSTNLSPARANGLATIINQMRKLVEMV